MPRRDVIQLDDAYGTLVPAKLLLQSGHPLRGARCLMCERAIGRERVRIYTVTLLDKECAECGNLTAAGFLVHDKCSNVRQSLLVYRASVQLKRGHHPGREVPR